MRFEEYSRLTINPLSPAPIGAALRDLVPFAQCKKREKHLRRSVTFSVKLYEGYEAFVIFFAECQRDAEKI